MAHLKASCSLMNLGRTINDVPITSKVYAKLDRRDGVSLGSILGGYLLWFTLNSIAFQTPISPGSGGSYNSRMSVSSGTSFVLSSIMTVLLFSGMQMYRQWLASSQLHTIFGGYLGSLLFILFLTSVGNMESALFGKSFQTKLFPEVVLCLIVSLAASGMVHRVSSTTCLIFSMVALIYITRISQAKYAAPQPSQQVVVKRKK